MIEIKSASISFGKKNVLQNVSVKSEIMSNTVILGKNGSGKSVLLKIAAGLLVPDSGEVLFDGKKISSEDYFRANKLSIGYVFQKGGLFDSMNLFDNVAFPLRRKGLTENEIPDIVLYNLRRVGLEGSEEKFPTELSGGMQKRAGIARVLAMKPKVILYDDPAAGLDPVLTDSIADLILEIRETEKTTSLIVTHDMKFAEKIADEIVLLDSSQIVFYGDKNKFFSLEDPFAHQFVKGEIEGPIECQ
ncbi:MAG TPA: ATP-binding cassette domain-containing protein [Spirochaetota bacterium]|nr:ATP-binding cassette domain-containing protein [Spirochaetota bacterium]HOH36333.1 ATP-binding cassette domain-containing protein [Spirochaetota bacterium]HPY02150.1 ATP-binding cassette domain-containing protein [Spirochaetota bacterium]HQA51962.1 ATP-binding cassette domain-containing protein [Spirochaetota bacterium]